MHVAIGHPLSTLLFYNSLFLNVCGFLLRNFLLEPKGRGGSLLLFQFSLISIHKEDKKMMASHKRKLIPRYHAYKPEAEFIDSDFIPQSWIYMNLATGGQLMLGGLF
jgi:hypothetical protein